MYKQAQFSMATHCNLRLLDHLEVEILACHTQVSVIATRGLPASSRGTKEVPRLMLCSRHKVCCSVLQCVAVCYIALNKASDDLTAFCKTFRCVVQACNGQHSKILYASQRIDARIDYFVSRSGGISLRCEVRIQVCVLRCF